MLRGIGRLTQHGKDTERSEIDNFVARIPGLSQDTWLTTSTVISIDIDTDWILKETNAYSSPPEPLILNQSHQVAPKKTNLQLERS